MTALDWSQCPAVESIPGKRSGAWVFKGTRTPVSTVFDNLQDMSINELVEEFGVTREQVQAVLDFAAQSADVHAQPLAVEVSCYDLASDLAGSMKGLPKDIADNPKYMDDQFGR
jgi:uncharacterized protein (DUF433 family)